MPLTRPTKLPRWATSAPTVGVGTTQSAPVVEPNEGEKDKGFGNGAQPPASVFQWLHLTAYNALAWLFDVWGETAPGGDVTTSRTLHAANLATAGALSAASAAVTGNATVGGTLGVTGVATHAGAVNLNGGATVAPGQTLTLTGATLQEGTLNDPTVSGTMTISPWLVGGALGAGTYGTGWSGSLGGAAGITFRKTPWGRIELSGSVYREVGSGELVYTLPAGYHPTGKRVVVASYDDSDGAATGVHGVVQLVIDTDGTVKPIATGTPPTIAALRFDGVSIRI